MPDFHKMAPVLSVLWIAAATNVTLATAQEATFSEGERFGLAACLARCPDGDGAWTQSTFVSGPKRLPIRFQAAMS